MNEADRAQAQVLANQLIGLPLTLVDHHTCLVLEFGEITTQMNRKGHNVTRGEWQLWAHYDWLMTDADGFALSEERINRDDGYEDEAFFYFNEGNLIVEAVDVSQEGC